VVDKVFDHRLEKVMENGIYWQFAPFKIVSDEDVNPDNLNNLDRYRLGNLPLPHLPWMEIPDQEKNEDSIT
jgi:hypothetical protein